jgi:adenine-specific DNA-methyltransferase
VKGKQIVRFGPVASDDFHPAKAIRHIGQEVELWPISSEGKERKWRYARQSVEAIKDQLEVRQGRGGEPVIYLGKIKEAYRTVWSDPEFNAAEYGSTLLKNIVGKEFSFPKSLWTVYHSLQVSRVEDGDYVLDYFAGSGTTGHAVVTLNREDGGRRKYLLSEMAEYFEPVLLMRMKKVAFCETWKDTKPAGGDGISQFFKYLVLEQYEDALNNLELPRAKEGELALKQFGDQYLLRYMLEFETAGSASLLSLEQMRHPFAYKLKVQEGDAMVERVVDLVETFNYLLGLEVKKLRQFRDGERLYRVTLGEQRNQKNAIVVWRDLEGLEDDAKALRRDAEFIEREIMPALFGKENKPDRVLVNGTCVVDGAEPIEPEFHRLMFAPIA